MLAILAALQVSAPSTPGTSPVPVSVTPPPAADIVCELTGDCGAGTSGLSCPYGYLSGPGGGCVRDPDVSDEALSRAEAGFSFTRPTIRGGKTGAVAQPAAAGPRRATPAYRATAAAARPARLVPVRMFLAARDVPPHGVGAYGIVALRGRPTPASAERLRRVCQAFVKYLPRAESLPASVPLAQKMVTAWPLDDPDAPGARADDCDYATAHYDLYGGVSAIQDATEQGATLTGRGPFLIGWSPSSDRGRRDRVVLVYDMSAYESQDSFDQAFIWWQQKVVSDPRLWRNGWSFEQVRISIRDFFDQYAASALEAIRLVGGTPR